MSEKDNADADALLRASAGAELDQAIAAVDEILAVLGDSEHIIHQIGLPEDAVSRYERIRELLVEMRDV